MDSQNEAKEYLYDLIKSGVTNLYSLTQDERRNLISLFILSLSKNDSIFEDQMPSRLWLSNFLKNPKDTVSSFQLASDMTDCISFAHEHTLEQWFDELLDNYKRENGIPSDYEDWISLDNKDRYADFKEVVGF